MIALKAGRAVAAALVLVAVGLPAQAQEAASEARGLYGSLSLGAIFPQDAGISGTGVNTEASLDTGYAALAALGYRYGNGFRSEIELGYARSEVDSISGAANGSGDVGALSAMINAYYDFRTGTPLTPYVGVGIGAANVNYDGVTPVGGSTLDDNAFAFAYQGIAGVAYALSPTVDLTADYRYFATEDAGLSLNNGTGVDAEYEDHRVMVGLRFNFGAPKPMPAATPVQAPAPQPAPAPQAQPAPQPAPAPQAEAVPQTYLVFFDWDRSNLRADAAEVVRLAAANAKRGNVTRIRATGHADRSGPDTYNMGLSQRRAETVRAELVRQGVPVDEIGVLWKGEREPLVQTPDGVREPQNRRVEIAFQ